MDPCWQAAGIICAVQHVAACFQPVGHEDGLQLGDDWPGNFVMIIAPVLRRIGIASPLIRDSDTADETNFSIDNQQFAMTAIVVAARIQPKDRMILDDFDTRFAQSCQIFHAHLICPLGIENGPDLHAGTRAFRQRFSEFASDLPVPEHVGLEINRMFGRANGAEHRRENLIAVYESVVMLLPETKFGPSQDPADCRNSGELAE